MHLGWHFVGPGARARTDDLCDRLFAEEPELTEAKSGVLVMTGFVLKQSAQEGAGSRAALIAAAAFFSLTAFMTGTAGAQTALTAEEVRLIEFGKEIFKSKAVCQYCHKWDASGDQGYGGNALSLRATHLTPEQLTEVVKCGRPGTGMPYHDRFAYTDKRCYGHTREEMGKDMPPAGNDFLSQREVDAVVKYLFAKAVGRGPATYEDCVDFWGKETRQCDPMKSP
jgi:mono/diheme cytochrome c family protein